MYCINCTIEVINDDIDKAVKKLQKKCMSLMKECKERQYYKKPSEIKHFRDKQWLYNQKRGLK